MLTDILTRHEARGLSCSSRFLVTFLGAPLHLLAGTGGPGNAKCEAKNGCEEKYQEGGCGCEEKAHDRASSQGDAHGFGKTGSESGKAETCSVAKERNKRSTAKPGDKAFRTGELARR